ncbi:Hypothetical predicted protein [Mytilus galloprovincialis]|uniref:Uncharacterized protein n=1 Tax=Mytilus galloprovincialis TaxID=29158 RepID=A0A8B6D7A7_MYTGA|nr:Hypothetical predicted protein [Mytilus galloprovincialis]
MKNRKLTQKEQSNTKVAIKKRTYRKKVTESRTKEALRKHNNRQSLRDNGIEQKQNKRNNYNLKNVFENRTSKHRAVNKLKNSLPLTPLKRVATLATYLDKTQSPTVRKLQKLNIVKTPEEQSDIIVATAVLEDIKTAINASKLKRSNESLRGMNTIIASLSGEEATEKKCRKRLAMKLNIPIRRISGGRRIRTRIMRSDHFCWSFTKRKTRADALSEDVKRQVYEYWQKSGISRPTGNKSDVKRERLGPNIYASHMIHILEKTQTEVYTDFKIENPEINISQRCFENCKPFFVRPVRQKDRQTCCCRYHVEIKAAFKACMSFRKQILSEKETENIVPTNCPVFRDIKDLYSVTLCNTEDRFYDISCLKRECNICSVDNFELLDEESDESESAMDVKWEKFEYINFNVKGGKTVRKLQLVTKETKAGVLFSHIKELLKTFPFHQHKASWQNEQFKSLVSSLLFGSCVCVHDFSENYRCSEMQELQSTYFQKTEVSVHVSIIHRHAMLECDGIESTEEIPYIITEHFYVISPDQQHDHFFVHEVRKQIYEYLRSISYNTTCIHEFTDGCPSQYKSRHCFGDLSNTFSDFPELNRFSRNFFETSHAKGPQDAAGGILKRQADIAVLRGRCRIQNAKDLYDFGTKSLTTTKSGTCRRRIFRYLETIQRDFPLSFKPVNKIRSIHNVRNKNSEGHLSLNDLSCFSCENCSNDLGEECLNVSKTGYSRVHMMEREHHLQSNNEAEISENTLPMTSLNKRAVPKRNILYIVEGGWVFSKYFSLIIYYGCSLADENYKELTSQL